MKETEIVKLYQSGNYSTYQIAERYDTYPNKIRRILVKHGVEMKSRSQAQRSALANGRAKHPVMRNIRVVVRRRRLDGLTCLKKSDKELPL